MSLPPPPSPTPLGRHGALSWACSALLQAPTTILHTAVCTCCFPSPKSSAPSLCPHIHCLHTHLIPALKTGSSAPFFQIPHTCVNIQYLFFSDLLHSVWQTLGPSVSPQLAQFHPFLWLLHTLSIHLTFVFYCFCFRLRMLPRAWNRQDSPFSRLWPLRG